MTTAIRHHFTVALAERCISAFAKGLVFDPFIGSGSTAIASEKLRRSWVGIEQSVNFVSIAERRVGKMSYIIDDPKHRLQDTARMISPV